MKPINHKNTGIPTSSNLISWEGGKLPLIQQCDSDTISDIALKTLCELEKVADVLDLSELDISGLYKQCSACPDPKKDVLSVLGLLIDTLKHIEESLPTIDDEQGEKIVLASCFRYRNSDGDLVLSATPTDYIKLMADALCTKMTQIQSISDHVTLVETDLESLKGTVAKIETSKTAQSVCVIPTASTDNPQVVLLEDFIEALEKQFCLYKAYLGETTQIASGVTSEPTGPVYKLTNKNQLLWTNAATTVGESLNHMWEAIKDIRTSISLIQQTWGAPSCDDIIIDFDVKRVDSDGLSGTGLRFFFNAKSKLPSGFTDADAVNGNKFTLTDSDGHSTTFYMKVSEQVQDLQGYFLDLTSTPLNEDDSYTISGDVSFTNGDFNCTKCINKDITFAKGSACDFCSITGIGSEGSSDVFVIIYE